MNTRPIPAFLALLAGFVTCIMSFVQHVDAVVFAKRFIFVCVIFYAAGMIVRVILDMNFRQMEKEDNDSDGENADEEIEPAEVNETGADEV